MKSCNSGIHSASCGGIWQCAVMGFGGVRIKDGRLKIQPKLPKEWKSMEFSVKFRGKRYQVCATHEGAEIKQCICL